MFSYYYYMQLIFQDFLEWHSQHISHGKHNIILERITKT